MLFTVIAVLLFIRFYQMTIHKKTHFSLKSFFNLFVSVTTVATFFLVCYMVFITSSYSRIDVQRDQQHQQGNNRTAADLPHHQLLSYEEKGKFRIPDFSNHSSIRYLEQIKFNRKRLKASTPSPSPNGKKCKSIHCVEFLSDDDLKRWQSCSYLAKGVNQSSSGQFAAEKKECRFINQADRKPVALASLPGSGNTWVRQLLEMATGLCTGAVYCDISLRASGFAGEHTCGGQALAIKTHYSFPKWMGNRGVNLEKNNRVCYGSAILLVRNPFNALVSEWNRNVANNFAVHTIVLDSHVKAAGREWFGEYRYACIPLKFSLSMW